MTNNEKFNMLINQTANKKWICNALITLFNLYSREQIKRAVNCKKV